MAVTRFALQSFWNLATWIGMRRLGQCLKQYYASAYGDTIFCFDDNPAVQGCVALTIDDGLSRGGTDSSLVAEVRDLLRKHRAHATFFVCTKYVTAKEAAVLLADEHELGNHLSEDRSGYYSKLSKEEFKTELQNSNRVLDELDGKGGGDGRWFRAPQGRMNPGMRQAVEEEGMRHVLGDCYCDDWAFAEASSVGPVAPLMLRQVQSGGSIAVFHMPERGFRESSLQVIEQFLDGIQAKGLRCVSLTEMAALQQ